MIRDTSSIDRPVAPVRNTKLLTYAGAIAVALAVLAALLLPSIRRWMRADSAVDSASVRFATVTRGDLMRDVSVQGRVVAALHPTLFSPGQGFVSLKTKAGSVVKQGDVLAVIDSKELLAALEQARAQLSGMDADLARQRIVSRQGSLRASQQVELLTLRRNAADRALERTERTYKEGLSNKTDYESAQDNVRIANMELAQAKQELQLSGETNGFDVQNREQSVRRQQSIVSDLEKRVNDLNVRAPFDGMVASVAVQDRDAVAPNQAIVTVVNLDSLELEIGLPEEYANETAIGTPASITVDGRDYDGRVTAISPEVQNNEVTATVTFAGERPKELKQSQRVTTRIVFESKKNVLKVPRGAFLESGGGRQAWVVDGQMATRRDIEIGAMSVGEVEIVKGLNEGEKIVLSDTSSFGTAKSVLLR